MSAYVVTVVATNMSTPIRYETHREPELCERTGALKVHIKGGGYRVFAASGWTSYLVGLIDGGGPLSLSG